jgi:hypothetical protein
MEFEIVSMDLEVFQAGSVEFEIAQLIIREDCPMDDQGSSTE